MRWSRRKHPSAAQDIARPGKLPPLIWVILVFTIIALLGNLSIAGKNITGWAWVIPMIFAAMIFSSGLARSKFPLLLWMPWISYVIWYLFNSEIFALQRSVQLLCPILIGMASSQLRLDGPTLDKLLGYIRKMTYWVWGIVLLKTGVLITGALPQVTGLAAEVMTVILLCTLLAASYSSGNSRDIHWWAALSVIPVIAVTRTAIAVAGMTLPLTFGPMKIHRRLMILLLIAVVGIGLFYTPRLQGKMFYKGTGEFSDVLDKDFRDGARFYMWERFEDRIRENPWFGYGAGSGEAYARLITNGTSGYPHNDWLLTLYDYGVTGTVIYAATLAMAAWHAYRRAKKVTGVARIFLLAGASAFLPFALMMFTDNIMVYVSYFGNLHFMMLGLGYGAHGRQKTMQQVQKRR